MGDLTRTLRALMPTGDAMRPRVGSSLGKLIGALGNTLDSVRADLDLGYLDRLPRSTRRLDEWDAELGLPAISGLTTDQRRARIAAMLGDKTCLAKASLQSFLQSYGFSVWVHEWTAFPSVASFGTGDVETLFAPLGTGYVLSNAISQRVPNARALAGQSWMQAGEVEALAGYFEGYAAQREPTFISQCRVVESSSPSGYRYPYLVIIGGQTFGTNATVPSSRKTELETLVLSRGRASNWHGFLVNYS